MIFNPLNYEVKVRELRFPELWETYKRLFGKITRISGYEKRVEIIQPRYMELYREHKQGKGV
jgi:hypothetical protein